MIKCYTGVTMNAMLLDGNCESTESQIAFGHRLALDRIPNILTSKVLQIYVGVVKPRIWFLLPTLRRVVNRNDIDCGRVVTAICFADNSLAINSLISIALRRSCRADISTY